MKSITEQLATMNERLAAMKMVIDKRDRDVHAAIQENNGRVISAVGALEREIEELKKRVSTLEGK